MLAITLEVMRLSKRGKAGGLILFLTLDSLDYIGFDSIIVLLELPSDRVLALRNRIPSPAGSR